MLGIGWFVASHMYGVPLETEPFFSFIGVGVMLEPWVGRKP